MVFFSTFTQGLYPGEIVLLILGVVLFFLLAIAFFYQLIHQRSITALLGFFIVPIIMLGYPSITSFQYKDGVISVEKATLRLARLSKSKSRTSLRAPPIIRWTS
jgi:hypothetical protein